LSLRTHRIEVSTPPLMTSACHCLGCQRMTGSAYALTITLPLTGFKVTLGEPVIGGLHGPDVHHHHCGYCLSWVFTRPRSFEFINLRATMLDDARWFRPFVETWTSEKLIFAETGALHSFSTDPDVSDYPALIAGYGRSGAKPG
jgi:hypothetical protein